MRKALFGILMAATAAMPIAAQAQEPDVRAARAERAAERYRQMGERNQARSERREQRQEVRQERQETRQEVRVQRQERPAPIVQQQQQQQQQGQSWSGRRSDGQGGQRWSGGPARLQSRGLSAARRGDPRRQPPEHRRVDRRQVRTPGPSQPAAGRAQPSRGLRDPPARRSPRRQLGPRPPRTIAGATIATAAAAAGTTAGATTVATIGSATAIRTATCSASGGYYSPYRNYRYNRLSIGIVLDSLFYSNRYWLSDPWQYRLPHAPYGTQWVRYYNDVVLVDIYSGEVIDVIYDFFW